MDKDEVPARPARSGDPVKGRTEESREAVIGETGALPDESAAGPAAGRGAGGAESGLRTGRMGGREAQGGTGSAQSGARNAPAAPAADAPDDGAGTAPAEHGGATGASSATGTHTAGEPFVAAQARQASTAGEPREADVARPADASSAPEGPQDGVMPPAEASARIAELEATLDAERQVGRQARARLQADFDNYRKRMLTEQARWRDDAQADLLLALLPVFDNLERAAQAAGDADAVRKGVDLTLRQLSEVLERAGLKAFESLGRPFDPNRHEAMAQQPADDKHKDGDVMVEYLRGYLWKGQVLRHALVVVARSDAAAESDRTGGSA